MDKKEAIELLKQELTRIDSLRELSCDNDGDNEEFKLLRYRVLYIVETAFGKDSSEYRRIPMMPLKTLTFEKTEEERKQEYNEYLDKHEIYLKSIIQKYKLLGFEPKTDREEQPKVSEDSQEKEPTRELEIQLEGTPDMILECIKGTIEKLNSKGYTYSFRIISGAPDYAKWDKTYSTSCAISQGDEGRIGTIKLQLLPKEKTSLKFSEPRDWDLSFGNFLNELFTEFQRLGFVDFEREKLPLGFKLPHQEKNV